MQETIDEDFNQTMQERNHYQRLYKKEKQIRNNRVRDVKSLIKQTEDLTKDLDAYKEQGERCRHRINELQVLCDKLRKDVDTKDGMITQFMTSWEDMLAKSKTWGWGSERLTKDVEHIYENVRNEFAARM